MILNLGFIFRYDFYHFREQYKKAELFETIRKIRSEDLISSLVDFMNVGCIIIYLVILVLIIDTNTFKKKWPRCDFVLVGAGTIIFAIILILWEILPTTSINPKFTILYLIMIFIWFIGLILSFRIKSISMGLICFIVWFIYFLPICS